MVNFSLMPWLVGFLVVAAVGVIAAVAAVTELLVSNRRLRVSRNEDLRTYYGRLVLSH